MFITEGRRQTQCWQSCVCVCVSESPSGTTTATTPPKKTSGIYDANQRPPRRPRIHDPMIRHDDPTRIHDHKAHPPIHSYSSYGGQWRSQSVTRLFSGWLVSFPSLVLVIIRDLRRGGQQAFSQPSAGCPISCFFPLLPSSSSFSLSSFFLLLLLPLLRSSPLILFPYFIFSLFSLSPIFNSYK